MMSVTQALFQTSTRAPKRSPARQVTWIVAQVGHAVRPVGKRKGAPGNRENPKGAEVLNPGIR
jgi:hypothetical protein